MKYIKISINGKWFKFYLNSQKAFWTLNFIQFLEIRYSFWLQNLSQIQWKY